MKKLLISLSLVSFVGCSSAKWRDPASIKEKGDKKVWTCAVLPRAERVESIAEARDRLEIFKSKNEFKFSGFGELERVNSVEGQGIFHIVEGSDKDEEYRENSELYKNSQGNSLQIMMDSDAGPKAGTFHVSGSDFEVLCLRAH